jgi:hypothetical protein
MVNEVTPLGELMNATRHLADRLLALPEKAATRTKHGIDGIFIGRACIDIYQRLKVNEAK